MTTAELTHVLPIMGVPDGKGSPDPSVRQAWLDMRAGGITATEIRDWGMGSKRREIISAKVTGINNDSGNVPVRGSEHTLGFYAEHGDRREPVISDWIRAKFGIAPCSHVYTHGLNGRHLASPDGVTLDPFTGGLMVGHEADLAEIKTSTKDLHPGEIDSTRTLIKINPDSQFARSNYYTQMQWQMYVMNAARTLFVWETHNSKVDPETGTFTPDGPPQYVWIQRDQPLIDVLVNDVAPRALAEIDAARLSNRSVELPPASEFPAEDAVLVADLLKARDSESVAKKSKDAAWKTLQSKYLGGDDRQYDLGFATVTVSTSTPTATTREVTATDWGAVRDGLTNAQRKKYDALIEKHTTTSQIVTEGTPKQTLTITAKKGKS